jgi:hypothetical protein
VGKKSRRKWEARIQAALALNRKVPWYERNLFWGPTGLFAASIFAAVAVMRDVRWLLWWIALPCSFVSLCVIAQSIAPVRSRLISVVFGCLVILFGIYKLNTLLEPKLLPNKQIATAVFMECKLIALPVIIPSRSIIRIIPLNKKRLQNPNWGFYQISNDSGKDTLWPDKKALDLSKKMKNIGSEFGFRCTVSNHGSENIVYLAVPIDLWFGTGKNMQSVNYRPMVSSLDVGKNFVFYLVNDCPVHVSAAWQDTARVQMLGESTAREVRLNRRYTNPAEQIMMFFPSKIQWIREQPCE